MQLTLPSTLTHSGEQWIQLDLMSDFLPVGCIRGIRRYHILCSLQLLVLWRCGIYGGVFRSMHTY